MSIGGEGHVALRVLPEDSVVRDLLELLKYEYIGLYGSPDPNPDGGLEHARGDQGAIFVIFEGHTPVGICGIQKDPLNRMVLRRMFVCWEHRGRGYSKRLLEIAEAGAVALGARELILETGTVQTVARALYTKAGYTPTAPFGYYAGQETSVFLGKELA
jgi:GNAT superfamily N-acetyltransferase